MIEKEHIYTIPNKEISWAGECPWTGGLCFGTHDGFLYFVQDGEDTPRKGLEVCSESINDVAFLGDHFAASSTMEITLGIRIEDSNIRIINTYPVGSFGVVAASAGFLFPIGGDGVLLIDPQKPADFPRIIPDLREHDPNCYRLIRLHQESKKEVLACASRSDGVFVFDLQDGSERVERRHYSLVNSDIIDICSRSDSKRPYAVACLSRDRNIYLIEDVLTSSDYISFHSSEIEGTAYSIHSVAGDLIVLTDREIDLVPGIAREFLQGRLMDSIGETRTIKSLAIDAEDVYLRGGKSILIIENSIVKEYPIDEIPFTSERESEVRSWNLQKRNDRTVLNQTLNKPSKPIDQSYRIA